LLCGNSRAKQLISPIHPKMPRVDKFQDGIVTSIKSIDLRLPSYINPNRLAYVLNQYVNKLIEYQGQLIPWRGVQILEGQIEGKVLQIAIPKRFFVPNMTPAQQSVFEAVAQRAAQNGVDLIITPIR